MALDRTSGFDMLVQISNDELNVQLQDISAHTTLVPLISTQLNYQGITADLTMSFGTPVVDMNHPPPQIGLTVPIITSGSWLSIPSLNLNIPLGGTIVVIDRVERKTVLTNRIIVMDFVDVPPQVQVNFDQSTSSNFNSHFGTGAAATAEGLMVATIVAQLQALQSIALSPPIPFVDDTDPTTIYDFDVTTVNDTSSANQDCLAVGIKMSSASGGNISTVTTNFIPPGAQSVVMMSNLWLLGQVMRPRVASALNTPVSSFNTPLQLNQQIPAPGGHGTLTSLVAYVEGNRIRVDASAAASGTGWSATADFTFYISISLSGGSLVISSSTPSVNTHTHLAWWVWLASLGLGALFGGIIGVIIATLVLLIVQAIANGIVSHLIASGINGSLGNIPAIPLGPLGSSLGMTAVVLDDLELQGNIIRTSGVPIRQQGGTSSASGFTVDLDTGLVGTDILIGTDAIWNPAQGVGTHFGSRLTPTGIAYPSLSAVQVSSMPLLGTMLPLTAVPISPYPWTNPAFTGGVTFGMRTGEGRLAKVQAWRNSNGTAQMRWTTYETPVKGLGISQTWSVMARGPATQSITPDCQYCSTYQVRRSGVFDAWPTLMVFPVNYQWCLCGQVISEGSGTVSSPTGPLAYTLTGRRLIVDTTMGQNVNCQLCVSAIDARGTEIFSCIQLAEQGTVTDCHKCVPAANYVRLDVAPLSEDLASWRPLIDTSMVTRATAALKG